MATSGIYLLHYGRQVYIGQAKDFEVRLKQHIDNGLKQDYSDGCTPIIQRGGVSRCDWIYLPPLSQKAYESFQKDWVIVNNWNTLDVDEIAYITAFKAHYANYYELTNKQGGGQSLVVRFRTETEAFPTKFSPLDHYTKWYNPEAYYNKKDETLSNLNTIISILTTSGNGAKSTEEAFWTNLKNVITGHFSEFLSVENNKPLIDTNKVYEVLSNFFVDAIKNYNQINRGRKELKLIEKIPETFRKSLENLSQIIEERILVSIRNEFEKQGKIFKITKTNWKKINLGKNYGINASNDAVIKIRDWVKRAELTYAVKWDRKNEPYWLQEALANLDTCVGSFTTLSQDRLTPDEMTNDYVDLFAVEFPTGTFSQNWYDVLKPYAVEKEMKIFSQVISQSTGYPFESRQTLLQKVYSSMQGLLPFTSYPHCMFFISKYFADNEGYVWIRGENSQDQPYVGRLKYADDDDGLRHKWYRSKFLVSNYETLNNPINLDQIKIF